MTPDWTMSDARLPDGALTGELASVCYSEFVQGGL